MVYSLWFIGVGVWLVAVVLLIKRKKTGLLDSAILKQSEVTVATVRGIQDAIRIDIERFNAFVNHEDYRSEKLEEKIFARVSDIIKTSKKVEHPTPYENFLRIDQAIAAHDTFMKSLQAENERLKEQYDKNATKTSQRINRLDTRLSLLSKGKKANPKI